MTTRCRLPSLAFLIPTRQRHAALRRSLRSIAAAASACGAEILIYDQSPQAFADPGPWRVWHDPTCPGLPAARNRLLALSHHDLLCFCDDDIDLGPDTGEILRRLAAAEPACVAWGPVVETRPRALQRLHRLGQLGALRDPRRLLHHRCDAATPLLFGCCFAVRGAAARACGFDARRRAYALGEDADFFHRLPGHKRFVRALRVIHREEHAQRADRAARTRARLDWYQHCARRFGRHNPASLLHLGLALPLTAVSLGHEAGSFNALLAGLFRHRHCQP